MVCKHRAVSPPPHFIRDPRHRYSLELRPGEALDAAVRALARALEAEGLLPAGATDKPRFHPHLTILRASSIDDAVADDVASGLPAPVTFTAAGAFGSGRIVHVTPDDPSPLAGLRATAIAAIGVDVVDPIVHERVWTPHVTVAYEVHDEARAAALERVSAALPITGSWDSVQVWDLDVRPTRLVHCAPVHGAS